MCVLLFCFVLCVYVLFNIEDAVSTLIPVNDLPPPTKWCHPHISSVPPTAFTIRPLMEGQSLFLGGPICTNFIRRHWPWNWSYQTNVLPRIPRDTAIHEAWVNPTSIPTNKVKRGPCPSVEAEGLIRKTHCALGLAKERVWFFRRVRWTALCGQDHMRWCCLQYHHYRDRRARSRAWGPGLTTVNNQINKIYCQACLERVLVPFWQKVLTFLLDLGGN